MSTKVWNTQNKYHGDGSFVYLICIEDCYIYN